MRAQVKSWPTWSLTERQFCDLELLLDGSCSPLTGYMTQGDYESVLENMNLSNGVFWPIPITLDVSHDFAQSLNIGSKVVLCEREGQHLAVLDVESVWQADRQREAELVYDSISEGHWGVRQLFKERHPYYVGGRVHGLSKPHHHYFLQQRYTPAELRQQYKKWGWKHVIAYHCRNPIHRAQLQLTDRAMLDHTASLLISPIVGPSHESNLDRFTRLRCYEAALPYYAEGSAQIALLPLATRMAGPREALWHAIIHQNRGCDYLIVGPHHGSPKNEYQRFYPPYAACKLLEKHGDQLDIEIIQGEELLYAPRQKRFISRDKAVDKVETQSLSRQEQRDILDRGEPLPDWFTLPEVAREFSLTYPPKSKQGFTIFITGLPSAGKSTLANKLYYRLLALRKRRVTLLDGDLVRKVLSEGLGFSKEDRDRNVRRVGYVASEITKHHGIALCPLIAPYDDVRREVRKLITSRGGFFLVYLNTPIETCSSRDPKGLYAKAYAGDIAHFTGVSDPYEVPEDADIVLDTSQLDAEACADLVMDQLISQGYIQ